MKFTACHEDLCHDAYYIIRMNLNAFYGTKIKVQSKKGLKYYITSFFSHYCLSEFNFLCKSGVWAKEQEKKGSAENVSPQEQSQKDYPKLKKS